MPPDLIKPFDRAFFLRPTLHITRELLGGFLFRVFDDGSTKRFRIVETEAYTVGDPACHAFRGKTSANAAMFGRPGTAYVHINYGIYYCLNAVCQMEEIPEAVLIRAIEPAVWEKRAADRTRYAGPGRLARTLGITKPLHNTVDLCRQESPLFLAPGLSVPDSNVTTTTRIGITKGADLPWRFYVTDSPMVSRQAPIRPAPSRR